MSCGSEIYIPNTTYESCDGTETGQALPVTVRGIIYTKKCPTDAEYDFEKLVLCEKTTGNKVLVESRTNVNDPAQARTTRYTYIATNTAFTGNPDTDLEDCSVGEKLDIQTEQYCDGGETVRGTLVWEVTSLTPNLLGIVFHKVDGTTHTPVAPVEGACVVAVPNRQVDVLEDCAGTTTATDVSGNVAQEVILSGSTKAIPVRVEECETQVLADHANGCIERTTLGTPSCVTSNESFAFTATDFIDFTVLSNDGNGNYTVVQTMMPSAHAGFLALANAVSIPDTRTVLDIAGGALILNLHNANFSNVVDLSPTSVQLDLHYEPGVTDTPIPLTAPCTDPVADSSYISSGATLRSIYDSYGIGIPQPNGGNTITYTLTHYTSVPSLLVEHIPAKQVINYDINGLPISDRYFEQSTLAEIVFDPATDVFKNVCTGKQTADIPNCDLTTTPTEVDSITATYILNQNNKHTEKVYDVVGAGLSGSALFGYTAPTNVGVDYSGVTITGDAILSYWTDFGDGYNDVGRSPSHSYNADGSYEIKGYAITASGNKLLLFAKEVNITSGTIIYGGANPQPVNRTYNILSSAVLQDYCNNTPVYTYKPNGGAYTTVGTLFVVKPDIIDELEDNADYQASISSPTNTVQTSTVLQLDAFGTIVGQVLRLDRVYDNTGALVSETYYDTVTGLPVLLNPLTAQIIDAHGLDTEIIELCDDNGTFLRHIGHAPGGQPISQRDTTIDGMTAYTTVGTVRKCTDCKKEIFATHIKWLNVPAVAYEMVPTLANHYGGTNDATNTYIHLIYPIQAGTSLTPIGPQLTEYFANPQNGVLFTDVATIQAMTDNALLQMGLSVGDAIYAVNTDNEPIWILSPTAEAELANSTYLHIYYGTVDTHNSYDQKADVNAIATNPNILLGGAGTGSCKPIQEIKEKDSCTGLETYRYIIEDGAGNLVPVTDVYPAFVESDVLHEPCKEPEVLEIREKEVCGFVDGSTSSYQLIRLYTRDSITGAMTIVGYEDVFGNAVTGAVVETCCTCDSICGEIAGLPLANRRGNSYGSFFGHNFSTIGTDRAYNNGPMYDQLALSIGGPTGSPMNHYNRVNVFDGSGTLITTAILGPYSPLSLSSSYTQFLSDLSSITSGLLVTFTNAHPLWLDYGYVMEYHDTTYFGITIHHGIDDHAGGIYRNNNAKRAIKYQAGDTQPFDSVNITGDLNNAYADAGFRERTNMRSVVPLQNVITI